MPWEVPQIDGLALAFAGLIVCAVAFALAAMCQQLGAAILNGINHYVHKIPGLSFLFGGASDWMVQKFNGLMTPLVNGLESNLGWYWNELGNLFTSLGNEIVGVASWIAHVEDYIYGVVKPWIVHAGIAAIHKTIKQLKDELNQLFPGVGLLIKELRHGHFKSLAAAILYGLEHPLAAFNGFKRWVHIRFAAIEAEIAHDIGLPIPHLKARTRAAEQISVHAWRWIRTHPGSVASAAFLGAIAAVLGRVGSGFIFCRNWKHLGKQVCRTPFGLFDEFLAVVFAAEAIAALPELVKEMQAVTKDTAGFVKDLAQV
jgi:hypothetical protein